MQLTIYQVDAFTAEVFRGNPAAVVPLDPSCEGRWPADLLLQNIAAENNLAETAFLLGTQSPYGLRWFTPAVEVALCGHATLASAYVLFQHAEAGADRIEFDTLSGRLSVTRDGDLLTLDFPVRPAVPVEPPAGLAAALGIAPAEVLRSDDWLILLDREEAVRALTPDLSALKGIGGRGVIVTAAGSDVDYVSRFFAPAVGIPEDPATGSSHCTLVPYWAGRLGRTRLAARQLSPRVGEFGCELKGDRVLISGRAAPYLEGVITV